MTFLLWNSSNRASHPKQIAIMSLNSILSSSLVLVADPCNAPCWPLSLLLAESKSLSFIGSARQSLLVFTVADLQQQRVDCPLF